MISLGFSSCMKMGTCLNSYERNNFFSQDMLHSAQRSNPFELCCCCCITTTILTIGFLLLACWKSDQRLWKHMSSASSAVYILIITHHCRRGDRSCMLDTNPSAFCLQQQMLSTRIYFCYLQKKMKLIS